MINNSKYNYQKRISFHGILILDFCVTFIMYFNFFGALVNEYLALSLVIPFSITTIRALELVGHPHPKIFRQIEMSFIGLHIILIAVSFITHDYHLKYMIFELAWGCIMVLITKYFTETPEKKQHIDGRNDNPENKKDESKIISIEKNREIKGDE